MSPHVPILGAPYIIKKGFPTILLQCACAKGDAILLVASLEGKCEGCGRLFMIAECHFNAQSGQLNAQIAFSDSQVPVLS